jgi:Protein of unknown function (DUF4012)
MFVSGGGGGTGGDVGDDEDGGASRPRRSRPTRRPRRPVPWRWLAAATVVVLLATAWVGVRGLLARGHLERARAGVEQLRADLLAAHGVNPMQLPTIQDDTRRARALTDDPIWRTLAHTPYAGRTLRTTSGLAVAVDDVAQRALPDIVDAGDALAPSRLRTGGAAINLAPLQAAQPALTDAAARLTAVTTSVKALPTNGVLPPVRRASEQITGELSTLNSQLDDAALAARLLPPMLGATGPRRYLVVIQDNAEVRGTGGLLGAFATLEATNGQLRLTGLESNDGLKPLSVAPTDASLPAEYVDRYADWGVTELWQQVNVSPHFPYAAQIWTAMWRARTGEQLDGVIAIDPFTLGYLLAATGPVRLDDGTTLTGANAAGFILKDEYAVLAGAQRKQYLVTLGRAVFDHLVTGAGSTRAVVAALGRAAGEGRLLIASPAHPAEQALLETRRLGGALPETTAPFAAVVINDAGSGKLDYYLGRRLSYNAGSCANGQRTATVGIALTNNAPASGLPDYVVTRADKPAQPFPRGQTRLWLSYFGTAGAGFTRATLDGAPANLQSETERGHPVFSTYLTLDPGQTRTLTLTLIEPAAAGTMTTLEQPIVEPQQSAVRLTPCTTG